jgi:uncharacterized membrane protein
MKDSTLLNILESNLSETNISSKETTLATHSLKKSIAALTWARHADFPKLIQTDINYFPFYFTRQDTLSTTVGIQFGVGLREKIFPCSTIMISKYLGRLTGIISGILNNLISLNNKGPMKIIASIHFWMLREIVASNLQALGKDALIHGYEYIES